jgi:hypothetical protein
LEALLANVGAGKRAKIVALLNVCRKPMSRVRPFLPEKNQFLDRLLVIGRVCNQREGSGQLIDVTWFSIRGFLSGFSFIQAQQLTV